MNTPFYVKCFYEDLVALYKKYNLSISHENEYGSFIIENYSDDNVNWIMNAKIEAEVSKLPEDILLLEELSWLDED